MAVVYNHRMHIESWRKESKFLYTFIREISEEGHERELVFSNDPEVEKWDKTKQQIMTGGIKMILLSIHARLSSFEGKIEEYPGEAFTTLHCFAIIHQVNLDFLSFGKK